MLDYFEARKRRYEGVRNQIDLLTAQLKKEGCKVYRPSDLTYYFFLVVKEKKHILVGYQEVPYSWYMYHNIKPNRKLGSSINKVEQANSFSIEEILAAMRETDYDLRKSTTQYEEV